MTKKDYTGKWRIIKMGAWDKDYFDEEVPAHIKIENNLAGNFYFGYVEAEIDGKIIKHGGEEFLEFTFSGGDNGGGGEVSGCGWIRLKNENKAEGEFRFHEGEDSTFQIKRMKNND